MAKTRDAGFDRLSPVGRVSKGKKIFLGIGINAYQHWNHLNNAVRDVEGVASTLRHRYGFDQVTVLRDGEATKAKIEQLIFRLTDPVVVGPNDSVMVYYSGHGHLDHNKSGYWVPVDAEKDQIDTYLANSRIRELMAHLKCRHALFVSDACFSGALFGGRFRGLGDEKGSGSIAEEYEKFVSRWAFCAGRHDKKVYDGRPGWHSPFAEAILRELGENEQKKLHIGRLADRVAERTREIYPQLAQASSIHDAGDDGGQFVFTLKDPKWKYKWPDELIVPRVERVVGWLGRRAVLMGVGVVLAMVCALGIGSDEGWWAGETTIGPIPTTLVPVEDTSSMDDIGSEELYKDTLLSNKAAIVEKKAYNNTRKTKAGSVITEVEDKPSPKKTDPMEKMPDTAVVKPPVVPPIWREPMDTIITDIPADVEMWLEDDDGKEIYRAERMKGKLVFVVPKTLVGKPVNIGFERNSIKRSDRVQINRKSIKLPKALETR